jgi:hypothetical protein
LHEAIFTHPSVVVEGLPQALKYYLLSADMLDVKSLGKD